MSGKPKEQIRSELIHEANQAAQKSDRQCSPCVWYVFDWANNIWERRAVALNDALQEKWKETESLRAQLKVSQEEVETWKAEAAQRKKP